MSGLRAQSPSLALIDWGIGGLGVRAALRAVAPAAAVWYFSDTGALPYGKMTASALRARLARVIDHLRERGATHVFLACNAASTTLARNAASTTLARNAASTAFRLPTTGIIEAGINAVLTSRATSIGIVGGRRTITSGIYRRAFHERSIHVAQRIAQPLSAAIEAGDADSKETFELVARVTHPLRNLDAVLLACTHYPVARAAFERALPGVTLIDPAKIAAKGLARLLRSSSASRGNDRLLTTGNPNALRASATAAYGVDLEHVESVRL